MNVVNKLLAFACIVAVTLCLAGNSVANATTQDGDEWQSLDAIRAAAEAHVEREMAPAGGDIRVQAAELDTRLRLPRCAQPLHAETPWSAGRGTRMTVRVSCQADAGWRVHVPVDIVVVGQVVTTARALARGAVLTSEDLVLAEAELGPLGHGYFAKPGAILGQRLKRSLAPGSVVTPSQLEAPAVIRRGQSVTLVANTEGITVKMNGTALTNGAIGQIVDIRNASSGRRVQGIVRSARSVEILLR